MAQHRIPALRLAQAHARDGATFFEVSPQSRLPKIRRKSQSDETFRRRALVKKRAKDIRLASKMISVSTHLALAVQVAQRLCERAHRKVDTLPR